VGSCGRAHTRAVAELGRQSSTGSGAFRRAVERVACSARFHRGELEQGSFPRDERLERGVTLRHVSFCWPRATGFREQRRDPLIAAGASASPSPILRFARAGPHIAVRTRTWCMRWVSNKEATCRTSKKVWSRSSRSTVRLARAWSTATAE